MTLETLLRQAYDAGYAQAVIDRRGGPDIPCHWYTVDANGCWVWQMYVNKKGYGHFRGDPAYRVVWEKVNGPIPEGMTLDHLCRNRRCVNPDHLEPVSHRENCLRAEHSAPIVRNAAKTHCDHGHPFDEANTYIRPSGARSCRACVAASQRRYQQRKRQAA